MDLDGLGWEVRCWRHHTLEKVLGVGEVAFKDPFQPEPFYEKPQRGEETTF